MKVLAKLREGDVLTTGMFPSLPANQLALWKEGENILFHGNRAEKMGGPSLQQSLVFPEEIVAITQATVAHEQRVYYGTPQRLYKWTQGGQIQLGAGYSGTEWSLETYGSWLIATNDVDPVQVWKNSGVATALNLEGTINRAKIIRKLENHLIAFNTSEDSQGIRWSSKSAPETWAPETSNSARGLPVRDLDSDIQAAEPFGNAIGFYSSDSFGLLEYVGQPFWFGAKVRLKGIGAFGKDCVIPVNNEHFGFGPTGIWRNNGMAFEIVDTPAVRKWLDDNMDPLYAHRIRGLHYKAKNLVCWFFRCMDGVQRGVGYNYKNGSWTLLQMAATAFDEQQVFDYPLVAHSTGWGFLDGDKATPLSCRLRTNALDGGDVDRWKLWDMVRVEYEGSGASIRFGFGENPGEPDEWTDWTTLHKENWIGRESPFLTIEFRSVPVGIDSYWALTGLEIYGEMGGYVA